MRIGIDIDDTLSESFELVFPFSQKFDIEELGNNGKVQTYGKKEKSCLPARTCAGQANTAAAKRGF